MVTFNGLLNILYLFWFVIFATHCNESDCKYNKYDIKKMVVSFVKSVIHKALQ